MTSECERVLMSQLKELNNNLDSIKNALDSQNQILTFISRDLSIEDDKENSVGIAQILLDIKNQLKIKKESK